MFFLLNTVIEEDEQLLNAIGKCLAIIFKSSYSIVDLPRDRNDKDRIEEMLQRPLYVLFRYVSSHQDMTSLVHAKGLKSSGSSCEFSL